MSKEKVNRIHRVTATLFRSIYLCQLVIAAILWVKLLEMFVTLMSLKCALSLVNDHVDIFLKLTD